MSPGPPYTSPPKAITTPCVKVCMVDPESNLCLGCFRTLPEIGGWARFSEDERAALASYQAYINRVFVEMVKAALIMIDERPVSKSGPNPLDDIRPEAHRVQVIAELTRHVQRMSLVGQSGK